ncbi:MAG: Unknown protein [uncultured Sulfurovum sp.]|uniref:Uncharacterized protein n=1 Tax=uncultured Sulfurovum sp. TaxID=269237 RepID=A0A6S6TKT8_9BACT|nr:MAG: Unknown protein [uncultured Sulfurovum sp.]
MSWGVISRPYADKLVTVTISIPQPMSWGVISRPLMLQMSNSVVNDTPTYELGSYFKTTLYESLTQAFPFIPQPMSWGVISRQRSCSTTICFPSIYPNL